MKKVIPLSEMQIQRKAREVIGSLEGTNPRDAIQVLSKSIYLILKENSEVFNHLHKQSVAPIHPDTFKKKPRGTVERNPDIQDFIHSLFPAGQTEVAIACKKKFGKRAPSKSAIDRYYQKLRKSLYPGDK